MDESLTQPLLVDKKEPPTIWLMIDRVKGVRQLLTGKPWEEELPATFLSGFSLFHSLLSIFLLSETPTIFSLRALRCVRRTSTASSFSVIPPASLISLALFKPSSFLNIFTQLFCTADFSPQLTWCVYACECFPKVYYLTCQHEEVDVFFFNWSCSPPSVSIIRQQAHLTRLSGWPAGH